VLCVLRFFRCLVTYFQDYTRAVNHSLSTSVEPLLIENVHLMLVNLQRIYMCVCVCAVGRMAEHPGHVNVSRSLEAGGTWSPQHCLARQRVAVVIPFRDRHKHLSTLLPVLHAMMQRQQLHYTVFVVEQVILLTYLRQRVAVVIPFRDRHKHLSTLLPVLHAMMQRQQLHYTVFVVEQVILLTYLRQRVAVVIPLRDRHKHLSRSTKLTYVWPG